MKILRTIFLSWMFFLLPVFGVIAQFEKSFNQKYVIVLDIQEHFTEKVLDSDVASDLIEKINAIINKSEPEHVIYIQSVLSNLSVSLSGISVEFLPGLNFDGRLNVVNTNVFGKNKANAFTSEEFRKFIESRKAGEFIVVGLMAEHCVLKTLLGGKNQGYLMYFVPEAVAGKSEESIEKVFAQLNNEGIQPIPFHSIK